MKIAVDGPAGAGKSSIAKLVAKKMNYVYVDTGAMFRAMAYFFFRNGIEVENEALVNENCDKIDIRLQYEDGEQKILLNGEDVSSVIRQEQIGKNASVVARYGAIRTKLLELQRKIASEKDVIMDGRDIGTVVLPDAETKIYLTASSRVRAERRYKELRDRGEDCDLDAIEQDIIARDEQDMNREIAPLRQAEDAVLVDSSDLTIPQVVDAIIEIAKKKESENHN